MSFACTGPEVTEAPPLTVLDVDVLLGPLAEWCDDPPQAVRATDTAANASSQPHRFGLDMVM
ncbi:MAG TPA: hypothetical protein VE983_05200 [Solirubrobacteraceae bacterium]|nr:hypothetical protein [Solirubrobacteraceae bacterium]